MYPKNVLDFTFEYYQKLAKLNSDLVLQIICSDSGVPVENTAKTEFPICPWCGREYKDYIDIFGESDRQVLCCGKETDNEFIVLRHSETKTLYSSHKIEKK